jgi:hypothetical protein
MRFHFGPYSARVLPDASLPYDVPLCRHVDDRHVPDGSHVIHLSTRPAPPDDGEMTAAMTGWTAHLAPNQTQVYLDPQVTPDYRFFNELFAAVGIGQTIQAGGFVLHASAIAAEGKAFLFSGLSGAGKSTIARHLGAGRRISDDQSMVVPWHGQWWCRSAFHLEHEGAPPARIFLIEQAPESHLEPLSPARALPLVMRHLVLWQGDGRAHQKVLTNLSNFLAQVPCFRLRVGLDDIRLGHLFADAP